MMDPIDSLLVEINGKLCDDRRIHSEYIPYGDDTGIKHSIGSCPKASRCEIIFVKFNKSVGRECWMELTLYGECDERCTGIFSNSMPPVGTFLQRRGLANILTASSDTMGCLCCFRYSGYVSRVDQLCARCNLIHEREGERLVKKKMVLGEILGEDCAGVVVGYLLCFFAERPGEQIGRMNDKRP
jgi:hypothetical protein